MNLDDFSRVADAALHSIGQLLKDWFPNGVIEGGEFCIGSRSGEAGKSMRIRMTGAKAGFWSDFSSDGDAGGDLISLYAYISDVSQGKACASIAAALGIQLTDSNPAKPGKAKNPPRPSSSTQREPAPAQAGKGVEDIAEKKPRTEWTPVLPVPDDAGAYPKAHPIRGRPEQVWEYRDQERSLLGIVCRFIASDGGKVTVPCVYAEHPATKKREWKWISFREPRPLYLTAALRDGYPVLVVEGEKCADAAYAMLADVFDVVSWPGGCKAAQKVGWTPIAGRSVTIWADADAKTFKAGHAQAGQIKPENEQPGMVVACKIADMLSGLDCVTRLVDIPAPGVMPDGWDIADLIQEGATRDDVIAWTEKLRRIEVEQPAASREEPLDSDYGRPEVSDDEPPAWVMEPTDDISTAPNAGAGILSWKALYELLIKTDRDMVKGCRENVFMALRHDPKLIGIVALDQFSQLQVKRRATPWPSEPGEWTEGDDFHLGLYLSKKYYLTVASIGEIEKAVAQAAREHAFDPVKDWMTECADKWDGQERLCRAFTTYWGATDSDYVRLISRMFFVGMVMRGFKPGVKHDCAPVFEGGQGAGKSSALAVLGGDWFADTPFRMGEKDGYLSIQGILIYEIAELEQFNRSEVTAVKAFMSSAKDRYREPYGRRMKNVPRRTIFAASTNEDKYFKDPTGNRRFWPIKVGSIDLDGLRRDRDQLIGEAVHLMRNKVMWYPTLLEQRTLIDPQQNDREIPHEWIGRLYDYCEGLDADGKPIFAAKLNRVSSRELITRALHIDIGKLGAAKRETMDVATCMRKLGWVKERESGGAREYYYVRPSVVESEQEAETEVLDDLPI